MGVVMLRKLLSVVGVSSLLIGASLSAARAADMPLKAPPPAPWYDWTGFYVGINAGYSWGNTSTSYTGTGAGFAPFTTSQNMDGGLGGGQIGYNWQFNRNWLFGLEADIQGTGQRGSASFPPVTTTVAGIAVTTITSTGTLTQKLPWFGTVRARLGIEPTDHWLVYATGGLAYGGINSTAAITTTVASPGGTATAATSGSNSTTRAGWTIGAGVEGVISGPWTAKLEYLYMDFGNVGTGFVGPGAGAYTTLGASSHVTDNVLRVGLNYRFPK
jgi:outer membrane immunogenic protein